MINKINNPWIPVFGGGIPQTPSGGGGGGGAWTFISNTAMAAAATIDITGLTGHTNYCAILRGLRSSQAFSEELFMRLSDDAGSTFFSSADHEGRKNSKHTSGTTETDRAYETDTSFELIDNSVNEGPDGLTAHGIWGKIWLWEPDLADVKEFLMDYSLTYRNENGSTARTRGFGLYPSLTNGDGSIDAFQLFMLNDFLASGSIDLYGIT